MAVDVQINPGFVAGLAHSPEVLAACRRAAGEVADEATRIGQEAARSYEATVTDEGSGARVEANTDGINAASWIEFGSQNNPASAPLRRGAEAAGLRSEGVR